MRAFLDTSVLIATFYADHQFHQPSVELFLRFKKSESSCGAHSLAEIRAMILASWTPAECLALVAYPPAHRSRVTEAYELSGVLISS